MPAAGAGRLDGPRASSTASAVPSSRAGNHRTGRRSVERDPSERGAPAGWRRKTTMAWAVGDRCGDPAGVGEPGGGCAGRLVDRQVGLGTAGCLPASRPENRSGSRSCLSPTGPVSWSARLWDVRRRSLTRQPPDAGPEARMWRAAPRSGGSFRRSSACRAHAPGPGCRAAERVPPVCIDVAGWPTPKIGSRRRRTVAKRRARSSASHRPSLGGEH